ncbi:MAG TPA: DUF5671 domain-containing protein [Candidatus Saccharimonadia bacterium]
MNEALEKYLRAARHKGHSDDRVRTDLLAAGWDAAAVDAALGAKADDLVPPPPPPPGAAAPAATAPAAPKSGDLVRVVPYRSTAGLEYLILFISLWVAAMALAAVLHGLVDTAYSTSDSFYEGVNTLASAALIVSFPIFAWLFLRLKKQELHNPDIRRDISRKNAVQLTLIVTFLIGLGKTIFYIYQLLNLGNADVSGGHTYLTETLHTLITVGISGGIFWYYWRDDHKKSAQPA